MSKLRASTSVTGLQLVRSQDLSALGCDMNLSIAIYKVQFRVHKNAGSKG